MFKNLWTKSASALLLASVSFNAFSFSCNEKSPAFIKEGDKYFNLSNTTQLTPLTEKQKKSVKRVFSPLKKRLKGKGTVFDCIEENGKIKEERSTERLSAEVDFQPSGQLDIQLEVYRKKDKTVFIESQKYFANEGFNSLIKQTRKSFSFNYKTRNLIGRGVGGFNEKFITLSVNGGVLTIETYSFYNGYFTHSSKRVLRP